MASYEKIFILNDVLTKSVDQKNGSPTQDFTFISLSKIQSFLFPKKDIDC